jgi:hypothetical protein
LVTNFGRLIEKNEGLKQEVYLPSGVTVLSAIVICWTANVSSTVEELEGSRRG